MTTITGLSTELIELFHSIGYTQKIEKGTFLFQEDALADELFIILSGTVQVSKIVPDGRELTLRMCKQDDIIGELSLFHASQRYMVTGKVITSGEVIVISKQQLESKLSTNHFLALEFVKWMSLQQQKTQTKFRDLILNGKKGALYSTLIRLANSFGVKTEDGILLNINLTNQELANFCGTSREVVNRFLSELRKLGIISVNKGMITIHNLHYIKQEIDCENCPIEICNMS
ncbi:Crp/Fnr family transcriptional regulator [Bacillus marasmi]|uniref:Crp/Fnr family transcriptional regulator n=1 Tax=Bacillus marasmi TaxID=1926279 RepID=UPI0011C78A98|nr:Crp/Fnr family transcriptional regulator [Bacillus marasmi]